MRVNSATLQFLQSRTPALATSGAGSHSSYTGGDDVSSKIDRFTRSHFLRSNDEDMRTIQSFAQLQQRSQANAKRQATLVSEDNGEDTSMGVFSSLQGYGYSAAGTVRDTATGYVAHSYITA